MLPYVLLSDYAGTHVSALLLYLFPSVRPLGGGGIWDAHGPGPRWAMCVWLWPGMGLEPNWLKPQEMPQLATPLFMLSHRAPQQRAVLSLRPFPSAKQ